MTIPNERTAPEWVDSGATSGPGRDLLGLRLPVQAIGNSLLDGVTTVTPSIRYLSFRSWIINSYVQARLPDSWASFTEFSAKAEAAIALANLIQDPQAGGLIGPVKGNKLLNSGEDNLPLEALVQQLGVTIYGGPSQQLLLSFSTDSDVPGLTEERGLPLARSVADQVGDCPLGYALSCGEGPEGASRRELEQLAPHVAITGFGDRERALLIAALLPSEPRLREIPRIASYSTILCLALELGRQPTEQDLFVAAIDPLRDLPQPLHFALDGWARYCVRDCLAVLHECVSAQVIEAAREASSGPTGFVNANAVIQSLIGHADDHREALRDVGLIKAAENPLDLSFRDVVERVGRLTGDSSVEIEGLVRWEGQLTELSVYETGLRAGPGALALLPVAWALALQRAGPGLEESREEFEALSAQGWARIGMRQVVAPGVESLLADDASFVTAMAELARRSVDQHLRVAWARMAADPTSDVSVIVSDGEDWVVRTEKYLYAGRTDSRIFQAIGWLRQLGLIDENGITVEGHGILEMNLDTLTREAN